MAEGRLGRLALGAAANTATALLAPVLAWQGRRVRREAARLPEARGPVTGREDGRGPRMELLVLGESTAAGVGASDHEEALAGRAARALSGASGLTVSWRVAGRSGATAATLRESLLPSVEASHPDVVLLAVGVNDVLRLRTGRSWRRDLFRLAEAIRERLGDPAVVMAGVPRMETFPALPQPLRAVLGLRARFLDAVAADAARALRGWTHVPLEPETLGRGLESEADFFASFASDGLHPSETGYRAWAGVLAPALEEALRA